MSTTDSEPVYEVEPARKRTVSIERGGRFGFTVESETVPQTDTDHLTWAVLMLVVSATGATMLPDTAGAVLLAVGAFIGGYAFNNWLVFRDTNRAEVLD